MVSIKTNRRGEKQVNMKPTFRTLTNYERQITKKNIFENYLN